MTFRLCLAHCLSSENILSPSGGLAGKQNWPSLVTELLLTARITVMAHIERRYPVLDLHVDFAMKEQTVQLRGLLTEDGRREIIEERT